MQLSVFDKPISGRIDLHELFEAYFACRKHKRNTSNAMAFEVDYESKLVQLCKELNEGTYQISRSIVFMIQDPVYREIFAADGDSIQFKRYPRPGVQGFSYMAKHPDDGYILSGGDKSIDGSGDVYVVRLDEDLEVVWEKTIEQPGFQIGYTVDVTPDNGYFVTGKSLLTWGMAQIIALKLDSLGNLEWYQTLGGEGNNDGRHNGTVLSDGNFLVAANVRNASDTDFDAYMTKLTPEGDIIWERTYSENVRTLFNTNVLELEDGSIVVGGGKTFGNTRCSYDRRKVFCSQARFW